MPDEALDIFAWLRCGSGLHLNSLLSRRDGGRFACLECAVLLKHGFCFGLRYERLQIINRRDALETLVDSTSPACRRKLVLCIRQYLIIMAVLAELRECNELDDGTGLSKTNDLPQQVEIVTRRVREGHHSFAKLSGFCLGGHPVMLLIDLFFLNVTPPIQFRVFFLH